MPVEMPPITPEASYCTRADVENLVGATNVARWADLDGDGDEVKIAARVVADIEAATGDVDDRLREGPYAVPFSAPVPRLVKTLATALAAVKLYEHRGVDDREADDESLGPVEGHRTRALETIRDLLGGRVTLDVARVNANLAPVVVKEDVDA